MVEIKPVKAFRDNYIWLIGSPESQHVVIVDPGDASPVLERIHEQEFSPTAILLTHHHPDHVGGVGKLLEYYEIPVYGPANEDIPSVTHPLREGDNLILANTGITLSVLEVPGHTAGAIAYHGAGVVFTGDTLFMAGRGRLFEGTPAQMHESLGKLAALPDSTKIYCGHEYTLANLAFAMAVEPENHAITFRIDNCRKLREIDQPTVPATLAEEKLTNPFLRTREASVRQAANRHPGRRLESEIDVLAVIRQWKDTF